VRVGILTNLHAKCGNAEYGRDLYRALSGLCEVKIADTIQELLPTDAVIVNHHPARVKLSMEILDKIRWEGAKSVVLFANSFDTEFTSDIVLKSADAVVANEPMTGDREVVYIPMGIPVVDELQPVGEPRIGVAGFAFPWKRFDVTAEVAKTMGVKCRIVSAIADIQDTSLFLQALNGHLGSLAEIQTNWLSSEEIVRLLSECTLNIFWYQSQSYADQEGQTGSARLGVAAKRPMIISRHRKFRTLLPYEDEFYIADTEEQVNEMARQILLAPEQAKRPNRVMQDMGWNTVAKKWLDLIEGVIRQ
jgi:hypothetical protein